MSHWASWSGGFFGTASAIVDGDLAIPHVDTGAEVDRDSL
jgi:hypothetical protein